MAQASQLAVMKFPGAKEFTPWSKAVLQWHRLTYGVDRCPLLYLLLTDEERVKDPSKTYTFDQVIVMVARLDGETFKADAATSHAFLWKLVEGTEALQWIQSNRKYQNGRLDWMLLTAHYQGVGNTSRQLKDAELIRSTLKFTDNRRTPFPKVLAEMEKMFEIFKENGEEYSDNMKLRFLNKLAENSEPLQAQASFIRFQNDSVPGTYDYAKAKSYLAAELEHDTPGTSISAVTSANGAPASGIYKDGQIYTGKYDRAEWYKLSGPEKKKVIEARGGKKSPSGTNGPSDKEKALRKKVSKLKKQARQQKRKIASMQKTQSSDSGSDDEDKVNADAGNAFGGKQEKRSIKASKKKKAGN